MDEQFAIVELMGHRRFGARISEADQFGVKFARCEILTPGDPVVQLVHPQSVYAITSCTEAQARAVNTRWSLQAALPMLPAEVAPALDADETEKCENCNVVLPSEKMAHDADGVPLCPACLVDLPDGPEDGTEHGGDGTDTYHG